MARVPYVRDEALVGPALRLVRGHPINLYRALAHDPEGLAIFAATAEWIRFGSRLSPRLRELAILAVGLATNSMYEVSHHIKIGKDFGLSDADIDALIAQVRGDPSDLGGDECLVIRAAIESTVEARISDGTFAELEKMLDAASIVELVLVLAHYSAVVRVLSSLAIDVEDDYRHFLDEHGLSEVR